MDWPVKFLDMNPIEQVWSFMTLRLNESAEVISNVAELTTGRKI